MEGSFTYHPVGVVRSPHTRLDATPIQPPPAAGEQNHQSRQPPPPGSLAASAVRGHGRRFRPR